ncbi:MAG: hypothetical protein AABZ44_01845, partial [Elusimicrobiota bacterium]
MNALKTVYRAIASVALAVIIETTPLAAAFDASLSPVVPAQESQVLTLCQSDPKTIQAPAFADFLLNNKIGALRDFLELPQARRVRLVSEFCSVDVMRRALETAVPASGTQKQDRALQRQRLLSRKFDRSVAFKGTGRFILEILPRLDERSIAVTAAKPAGRPVPERSLLAQTVVTRRESFESSGGAQGIAAALQRAKKTVAASVVVTAPLKRTALQVGVKAASKAVRKKTDGFEKKYQRELDENYAIAVYRTGHERGKTAWKFADAQDLDSAGVHYYALDEEGNATELSDRQSALDAEVRGGKVEVFTGLREDPSAARVITGKKAATVDLESLRERAQTMETEAGFLEKLNDPRASAKLFEKDSQIHGLASELASLIVLEDGINGKGGVADPILEARLKSVVETTGKVTGAMDEYKRSRADLEDMQAIYAQILNWVRTQHALQDMMKANVELTQVLLLKRAYVFLELANGKLKELKKRGKDREAKNSSDIKDLEGRKKEAARRLAIAKKLLADAESGKDINEVKEDIKDAEDALAKADHIAGSIDSIKDILKGNFGNLTSTFLDPKVVDEEIADWEDILKTAEEKYIEAYKVVDPIRQETSVTEDDFGDTHFRSAHLWSEQLIVSLQASGAKARQAVKEFKAIAELRKRLEKDRDAYYLGIKGDREMQTTYEQKKTLLKMREGESLIDFGTSVLEYKTAESTLNGLFNAYVKDAGFHDDIGPEPYYESTINRMNQGRALAQQILKDVLEGLNMERHFIVDDLGAVENAKYDEIVKLVSEQFQAGGPQGVAHRGLYVSKKGRALAQETLKFYYWKKEFLSSGPSYFQIENAKLVEKQSDISNKQKTFAEKDYLPFLKDVYLPFKAADKDTYKGFIALYEDGYGTLYSAEEAYYKEVTGGLESFQEFIDELEGPFKKDFENVRSWLDNANPKQDPAIRRMGRALNDAAEEQLERMKKKRLVILANDKVKAGQHKLKMTLEELRVARQALEAAFERSDVDDPNFAKAREALLEGDLLYGGTHAGGGSQDGPLFIQKSKVERMLQSGASGSSGDTNVGRWMASLGVGQDEVIPVGDGKDAFYVVVNFEAGTDIRSAQGAADNGSQEALLGFGNLGEIAGHNLTLSVYDWKNLAPPSRGSRGIRTVFDRDKDDERLINTTVLDLHQNLQQGDVMRAMVFENMAFLVFNDKLYISLAGFGDFPSNALDKDNCQDIIGTPGDAGKCSPYTVGGRAKAVLYFHEAISLNAELMAVFAQDPYNMARTVNTSLDPLAMEEQYVTLEGALLRYVKQHAGVEFDLAKIFSQKQTFAIEFFLERERAKEEIGGNAVSKDYREKFMDDYDKTWKGARLVKEIHFKLFNERTTLRSEARAAWDQNGELEPSGRIAYYLPGGVRLEAQGARYGDKYTGRAGINLRLGSTSEMSASYGTSRINAIPTFILGIKSMLTLEDIRSDAMARAESAMQGGKTLEDFRDSFDAMLPTYAKEQGDASLAHSLRRVFENNARIQAITHEIGSREARAIEVQKVIRAGIGVHGGLMTGFGYTDKTTGKSQSGPGNHSTASGIEVGGEIFAGISRVEKEKAFAEIARIKVLLQDLRQEYEDSLSEFQATAYKYILARLRMEQIKGLRARHDKTAEPLLTARLQLEESHARWQLQAADVRLRNYLGIGPGAEFPREIASIPIDAANPRLTLEATRRALAKPGGWKKFLNELVSADPISAARPPWVERLFSPFPLVNIIPLVDDLEIRVGQTLWDTVSNSFVSAQATVRVNLWDGEKSALKEAAKFEIKIADLEVVERLKSQQAKKDAGLARFNEWALGQEKETMGIYLGDLDSRLAAAKGAVQALKVLDLTLDAQRELARIEQETLSLPQDRPAHLTKQAYRIGSFADTIEQARKSSKTLAALALK